MTLDNARARRVYAVSALAMLALTVLYRLTGILYSYCATNILYSESALPAVLEYVRGIFYACAVGTVIGCTVFAVYRKIPKPAKMPALAMAVLAADALAAFLADFCSGAVVDATAWVALLTLLLDFLYTSALLWLALWLANFLRKRNASDGTARLWCVLLYFAGRFIPKTVSVLSFLIEVEFLPYATEVSLIVGEYLQILVLYGGVVWVCAVLFDGILTKIVQRKVL